MILTAVVTAATLAGLGAVVATRPQTQPLPLPVRSRRRRRAAR